MVLLLKIQMKPFFLELASSLIIRETVTMSLAALNSPPLVAVSGVVAASLLPTLDQAIVDGSIPFNIVKLVNALLYALNVFAAQQPGRIDSMRQEEFEGSKEAKEADELAKALLPERRGRSLVSPR